MEYVQWYFKALPGVHYSQASWHSHSYEEVESENKGIVGKNVYNQNKVSA